MIEGLLYKKTTRRASRLRAGLEFQKGEDGGKCSAEGVDLIMKIKRCWIKRCLKRLGNRSEKIKVWTEIASNCFTVLGIIGAGWVYYQWDVSRGDHAVDFLFKLDDKFNSAEVEEGRDLIDWDVEYNEIKNELKIVSDPQQLAEENEKRKTMSPDDLAKLKTIDNKVKKVDAMLQFYETLSVVHQQKQAPTGWLRTRYSAWMNYYYEDSRKEFRQYVDVYYPSLSRWLHEDLTESDENRYFHPSETSPFYTNNLAH